MNLLLIKYMTDGSIVRSFLNYPTRNDAMCAFYNELAYAIASADIKKIIVALIDDNAYTSKVEVFDKEEREGEEE